MGWALSWAAVKGGTPKDIFSLLRLRFTGRLGRYPNSAIVGSPLDGGWYVIVFTRREMKDRILQPLSSLGEAVYCFVVTHVMFSTASGWMGGKRLWSVTHESEKEIFHLDANGRLPPIFGAIRERLLAQQNADGGDTAEVDHIMEVPIELARELTGFRHDQKAPETTGDCFEVLERVRQAPSSLLAGLFRRNTR